MARRIIGTIEWDAVIPNSALASIALLVGSGYVTKPHPRPAPIKRHFVAVSIIFFRMHNCTYTSSTRKTTKNTFRNYYTGGGARV